MARPTEAHVATAAQLLNAFRAGAERGLQAPGLLAEALHDALFRAIAPVLGETGFRALFARSVKLTQARFVCLKELGVAEPLQRHEPVTPALAKCLGQLQEEQARQAATALYATLLMLLASFIGEGLVERLIDGMLRAPEKNTPEVTE